MSRRQDEDSSRKRSRSRRDYSPERKYRRSSHRRERVSDRYEERETVDYSHSRYSESDRYHRNREEYKSKDDSRSRRRDDYRRDRKDSDNSRSRTDRDRPRDSNSYKDQNSNYTRGDSKKESKLKGNHNEKLSKRDSTSHTDESIPKNSEKYDTAIHEVVGASQNIAKSTDDYLEKLSEQLDNQNADPEALIEERRRKRRELLNSLETTEKSGGENSKPIEENMNNLPAQIPVEIAEKNTEQIEETETAKKQDNNSNSPNSKEEESDEIDIDLFGDDPIPNETEDKDNISGISWENSVEEDWDDAEGYMRYRIGEIMADKYRILGTHGKGVFSQVLKVEDINTSAIFAIKVNRNNETMKRAGETERNLLLLMKEKHKTRNVVLLYDSFEYKKHLCLVLEPMEFNLREVIQTFGGGIGITIQAVRFYTRQLLTALKNMKQCNILHADIKPDNIVVSKDKRILKVCDLGTASDIDSPENEITPLLVSRYYRPPEVILGLKYNEQVDLWSAACCIFEMYTGKILFPGKDNNDMLRIQMEFKGKFSKKMLKRGMFSSEHFDEQGYFLCQREEPGTKKLITQKILINQPTRDMLNELTQNAKNIPEAEMAELRLLKDLLQKMFILDPTKRISVEEAIFHPFVVGAKG